MNKTILNTSLIWLLILAAVLGLWRYRATRTPAPKQPAMAQMPVAPIASGPTANTSEVNAAPSEDAKSAPASMRTPLAPIQLTREQMQAVGVRTGTAEYQQLDPTIRATGTVAIDEQLLSYVQVRFPGYIRRVFADATYQYVRKGEPLFTIYSPELVATEQEYLQARTNQASVSNSTIEGVASGAAALTAAADARLEQWEIPASELAKLHATGKPITDLTFNSPSSGYITERNALPNLYAEPGTKLYTLADLSRVWVNAQVFQNDIGRVKPGDAAVITVDSYPGRTFSARVEQILPQVDMTTRTVMVRIAVANPGIRLKPGMFVNVELQSSIGRQLTVPAAAVFETGTRTIVFLDHGNGSIEPKDVVLGPHIGDSVVVLKGLTLKQPIVTAAGFLIDSESQLQASAGAPVTVAPTGSQAADAKLVLTTTPNPPSKGTNTFHVMLSDAQSKPIADAEVTVVFYMPAMPAMGMGAMNTTVTLAPKGSGLYEGTGTLGSGGTWQVTLTAKHNGQVIASKQLRLNAEGGM